MIRAEGTTHSNIKIRLHIVQSYFYITIPSNRYKHFKEALQVLIKHLNKTCKKIMLNII